MFVKERRSGDLLRVKEIEQLLSPLQSEIVGRHQAGEEEQDEERFAKSELVFPSGEPLPRCWTDPSYQSR
ncbi:acetyltransferase [Roseimaritima sediminicola]|uniref:acetyltransferase n=1 Tax=Roseimaritima sediminicola TaxID=2662066 RepID=UPI00129847E4|nr:acetyltransferase [Roseimaritima sediminicola]